MFLFKEALQNCAL